MRTRLVHPVAFRRERSARDVVEGSGLFNLGAQIILPAGANQYRIIIDCRAEKADALCRYLSHQTPGVEWQRSEMP